MQKKTHAHIAEELSKRLGLFKERAKVFAKAVVKPDEWHGRSSIRRHYPQRNTVLGLVKRVRWAYVKGDLTQCLRNLGLALHFVQDTFIPPPRTRELRSVHARLETKLEHLRGLSVLVRGLWKRVSRP